jgi:hypothetical protein
VPIPPALHGRRATPSRRHPAPPQAQGHGRQRPTGSKTLARAITGPEPYAESPRISLHATGPRLRLLAATDQETAASSNRQALASGQIHPQIDRSPIFRGLRTALLPHSKQRTQRSTQLLLIAGTLTPNNFGGRGDEHESLTSTRDSTHHWPNRDDKAASSRPVCVCAVELSTRS